MLKVRYSDLDFLFWVLCLRSFVMCFGVCRLHEEFGKSKIVSFKPVNGKIEMVVENASAAKGNFTFTFENKNPYLIDGVRVELNQHGRN